MHTAPRGSQHDLCNAAEILRVLVKGGHQVPLADFDC